MPSSARSSSLMQFLMVGSLSRPLEYCWRPQRWSHVRQDLQRISRPVRSHPGLRSRDYSTSIFAYLSSRVS
ncbi:hypothetical protein FDH58_gp54 [Arthrobacter phage HunterDalle]|uniref:Uncharacterized protein n=2 Tax=Korravirus hunterdalle TaxID=1982080 RepID=A0A0U4JEW7_9CAUD|nr:hypothetical protein FDH58_gp54 [Arthrobacter phage HunterDalle]ALY09204.1 hypothetical protein HUNTERDALLE_54 [Arthrobacter phage HunterDalle]ALY10725.1 hypothetical protein VULTURE_54 [Arthrobacter phage Vulture]